MAPVSKSDVSGGKTSSRQLKSHDNKQSSMDSPSSRQSYSSSRGQKGHHHRRRRSSPTALKSSLRETLSSFGDDVIKAKKYASHHAYDNHGYFQSDLSLVTSGKESSKDKNDQEAHFSGDKEGAENELAIIMSHHDPSFQTKHFEKVNPNEVGTKPSKWQQLLQGSVSSDRFQKLKRQTTKSKHNSRDMYSSENTFLETFYNNGRIECDPPFWGVSRSTRGNFSFLSLSLILHELACFASCVLLGCMIFQGMEAISWTKEKPFTENWLLFKCFSSFQTILVVITCIGFLNRVDTTDYQSLWLLPLCLIPVLGLAISDYCNKAWELQRLECFNFFRLDDLGKQKVHLSQDCSSFKMVVNPSAASKTFPDDSSMTELTARGIGPFVMRILAMLSILVISIYLFCCRKSHFLINLFGPPQEFGGNLELALFEDNGDKRRIKGNSGRDKASDTDEDVKVIYKRNSYCDN